MRSEHGRRGIGRAPLRALEEFARGAGLQELKMDASINAEAFYRANGFSTEAYAQHPMASGRSMACARMRKAL